MILAVKIQGVTSSNLADAVSFIGTHLLMRDSDIKKALNIEDFIFYSKLFDTSVLTGYSFTIIPIDFNENFYININSAKLEVPINGNLEDFQLIPVKTGQYILDSQVNYFNPEVMRLIKSFLDQRQLFHWGPSYINDDYNEDFEIDFDFA